MLGNRQRRDPWGSQTPPNTNPRTMPLPPRPKWDLNADVEQGLRSQVHWLCENRQKPQGSQIVSGSQRVTHMAGEGNLMNTASAVGEGAMAVLIVHRYLAHS